MAKSIIHTGDYTAAKLQYLSKAARLHPETMIPMGAPLDCKGGLPSHPYGIRMVKDGLAIIRREIRWSHKNRRSYLLITEQGRKELQRLMKRVEKTSRRHAHEPEKPRSTIPSQNRRGHKILVQCDDGNIIPFNPIAFEKGFMPKGSLKRVYKNSHQ